MRHRRDWETFVTDTWPLLQYHGKGILDAERDGHE
jgi:hypothetical protein